MFVTTQTESSGQIPPYLPIDELVDAVAVLGLESELSASGLVVDGVPLDLDVIERAHPHPAILADIVAKSPRPALLIADRISEAGRQVLRDGGWSWLDRRGHMRIWVPGLRVDAPIGLATDTRRAGSKSPWTPVGLELALYALLNPDQPITARAAANEIGRSAGGTQEILGRFTEHGLIGPSSRMAVLPELFWETSAHWPDRDWLPVELAVNQLVEVAGGDPPIRAGERAATLGGAMIPAAGDMPARCYVNKAQFRRLNQYRCEPDVARCFVRVAPIDWLPENEEFAADNDHPWRIAHPMVCALRLARDSSRGRELVEAWGVVPQ